MRARVAFGMIGGTRGLPSLGLGKQAAAEHLPGLVEARVPGDFRGAMLEAIPDFLKRVERHVRTGVARAGDARHRMKPVLLVAALKLSDHVGLRGDKNIRGLGQGSHMADDGLRATHEIASLTDVGRTLGMGHRQATRQ